MAKKLLVKSILFIIELINFILLGIMTEMMSSKKELYAEKSGIVCILEEPVIQIDFDDGSTKIYVLETRNVDDGDIVIPGQRIGSVIKTNNNTPILRIVILLLSISTVTIGGLFGSILLSEEDN